MTHRRVFEADVEGDHDVPAVVSIRWVPADLVVARSIGIVYGPLVDDFTPIAAIVGGALIASRFFSITLPA